MLAWDRSFSLNIRRFDAEHVVLVGLLNQLFINLAEEKSADVTGEVLTALLNYTDYHFQHEETILQDFGYPNFAAHKLAHDEMIDRLAAINYRYLQSGDSAIATELRAMLAGWVLRHVARMDGDYASWFRDRGLIEEVGLVRPPPIELKRAWMTGPALPVRGSQELSASALHRH